MADKESITDKNQNEAEGSIQSEAIAISFVVVIFFLNMLSRIGLAPLLPEIERNMNLAHAQAGALFLFVSVGYAIGLFGSTYVSSRICHHNQIVLSSVTVGAALLLFAWSEGIWSLRVSLIILGVTSGLYLPSGVATLTSIVRKSDWGKVLAIHQLAPNLAFICGPLMAAIFIPWISWRVLVCVYGLAAILLGFAFFKFRHAGNYCSLAPNYSVIKDLLKIRSLWVLIIMFSLALGVNQGVYSMLPLYLTAERGMEPGAANRLISYSRMAAFFIPLFAGWISDRKGLTGVLFVVCLTSGASVLILAGVPDNWITLAVFLQALSGVSFFPLGFAALSRMTQAENRNIAVALMVPVGHMFGAGLTPTIIGFAGDMGSFTYGFYFLGITTLLGLYLFRYMEIK